MKPPSEALLHLCPQSHICGYIYVLAALTSILTIDCFFITYVFCCPQRRSRVGQPWLRLVFLKVNLARHRKVILYPADTVIED